MKRLLLLTVVSLAACSSKSKSDSVPADEARQLVIDR
jgi:hypothetical protein